jgi:hypothetical protein
LEPRAAVSTAREKFCIAEWETARNWFGVTKKQISRPALLFAECFESKKLRGRKGEFLEVLRHGDCLFT